MAVVHLLLQLTASATAGNSLKLKLLHAVPSVRYGVQSKTFAADPQRLYVTSRGDNGSVEANSTTNALLAVYDIGGSAVNAPTLLESWAPDGGKKAVEGLDRCGDLLAVVGITDGTLYVLNASCIACEPIGEGLKLSTSRALHVRLVFLADASASVPWGGCGGAERGRVFALVTSGFAQSSSGRFANKLIAVDVSEPDHSKEVATLGGMPSRPEGIFIHGSHAYVGGCFGSVLAVIDISRLRSSQLVLAATVSDDLFVQMVSTQREYDEQAIAQYLGCQLRPRLEHARKIGSLTLTPCCVPSLPLTGEHAVLRAVGFRGRPRQHASR